MLTYSERKALGLRNKDIAAKVGVDAGRMSLIRNGRALPSLPLAFTIYDACGEQYGALKGLTSMQVVALRSLMAAQA